MRWIFVVLTFVMSLEGATHPLKMAYTSVKYNPVRKVFEISQRVFQDDFENTLRENYHYENGDVFINQQKQEVQKAVQDFFAKNFLIAFNNTTQKLKYMRIEQKHQMGIVVYFETERVDPDKIKAVQIYNTIMMESFKEQVNMFHLNINEEVKRTTRFETGKTKETLEIK